MSSPVSQLRHPEPEIAAPAPMPVPDEGAAAPVPAAAPQTAKVLDTEVAARKLDIADALRIAATTYGKPYQQVLLEIAKLSFGGGKLAIGDYFAFRLFDDAMLAGADKSQFVGLDGSRRIWTTANFDSEWWGLMANKLAVTTLLGGYGYPVIPTLALYSATLPFRSAPRIASPEALATFLRNPGRYPLFGKPMDSLRSLGSASFDRIDLDTDELVSPTGSRVKVEAFSREVADLYGAGYILQRRAHPHAAIRAIVGDRLATVRMLTLRTNAGTRMHRAVWKIPAGGNVADNFWRGGNQLATLDLETGRVLRVVRGVGLQQEQVTHHPDSGEPLIGFTLPLWDEMRALVCEAAGTLGGIRLVGWDVAATDTGPLIVEPNYTPDFDMVQMADRRGILDEAFKAFLAECREGAKEAKRRLRRIHLADTKERFEAFSRSMGLR
ncbi:MAG: sugar-transfer associated ATP-grasp domain-containing protein [Hyphomicrobiaceae bacterium]|nr:sugar-transfer associated ATP-grasp domain-containing protein [Hyphomicrobiaceae bacterium]